MTRDSATIIKELNAVTQAVTDDTIRMLKSVRSDLSLEIPEFTEKHTGKVSEKTIIETMKLLKYYTADLFLSILENKSLGLTPDQKTTIVSNITKMEKDLEYDLIRLAMLLGKANAR